MVLASGQANPVGIAVAGATVYWTNKDGGTVMKVGRAGGVATTLASGQLGPLGIVADGTSAYWSDQSTTSGRIMKVGIDGGTPVMLASVSVAYGIAVDTRNVYWTANTLVMSVPIGGGVTTTLVPVSDAGYGVRSIAIDQSFVYWESGMMGFVKKVPLDGGTPITVVTGFFASGLAVDGTYLFVLGGQVSKLGSDGSNRIDLSQGGGSCAPVCGVAKIVVDSEYVYWAASGPGTTPGVARVGKVGGAPITLAPGGNVGGIAVDSSYLYWTDLTDGTIVRLDK